MSVLINEKRLIVLLKKVEDVTGKKHQDLETVCTCCRDLADYIPLLRKKFPEIVNFYSDISNKKDKKHHTPSLHVFKKWRENLTVYINYLIENKKEFLESIYI
ncbi:MAG: hypothetical protein JW791_02185 [Nanoarchaeota archaeon]|nr:hypothetical protein [Nanoarchaeota archaeon]